MSKEEDYFRLSPDQKIHNLKKMRDHLTKKIKNLQEEVTAIDNKISKLESKNSQTQNED